MKTDVKKVIITLITLWLYLININYVHIYKNIIETYNTSFIISKKLVIDKKQAANSKTKDEIKKDGVVPIKQDLAPNTKPTETQKTNITQNKDQSPSSKDLQEKQPSRGGSINTEIDLTLTFYSSLPEENGGFNGINCIGQKLTPGTVANNVLPLGTKIHTNEFGVLTVADKGGSNFNTIHRLDVFIPKKSGESNSDYKKRVNKMGIVKIKGAILN